MRRICDLNENLLFRCVRYREFIELPSYHYLKTPSCNKRLHKTCLASKRDIRASSLSNNAAIRHFHFEFKARRNQNGGSKRDKILPRLEGAVSLLPNFPAISIRWRDCDARCVGVSPELIFTTIFSGVN